MSETSLLPQTRRRIKLWLLEGYQKKIAGPHTTEGSHQHPWWQVMCLTGVDYFSTLGYQPGIAFLAAGALSPLATLVLVLLTLFGALPMYHRVAEASPHGDGSISMLENLLPRWRGKFFVLCLLGFAATSFIITITLSAADATAHIAENPYAPAFLQHRVGVTLVLIAALGAIFLKGFAEAINLAVGIVVLYISLNLIIVGFGMAELVRHPQVLGDWQAGLVHTYGDPLAMVGAALFVFPKLALGLSGFETGVVVMPLVRGDETDTLERPTGRIRNTRKLLTAAALIMSVMLIGSSMVTTTLIPAEEFQPAVDGREAGKANGRALAYLAHLFFGDVFGTVYDLSTILILWFAGASAMAGLLNIVPRYLPRYGMAPEWTRAIRPLVLVFTTICFVVTVLFKADVTAQGGAYATGVLALMSSAAIAVALATRGKGWRGWAFGLIALVFIYTTVVNIYAQPEGLKIALIFIGAIIFTSLLSRVLRTTELRVEKIEIDAAARAFINAVKNGPIRIIANQLDTGDATEYRLKEAEQRYDNHIPAGDPVIFLEVYVNDASEFADAMTVEGVEIGGYRVLRAHSTAVPNAIAAFLLHLRNTTGTIPHIYFGWTEGNPVTYLMKYLVFGEGYTAPVTHEILRQTEPDPRLRPVVHVG
jgi:amino acid permease-like protein